MTFHRSIAPAACAAFVLLSSAPAAAALDLGRYAVAFQRTIGIAEASGIAYNYDKDVLFVIDDEGVGGAEFSRTGDQLTSDRFVLPPNPRRAADIEGVTYVGNGRYVVAEERFEELIKLDPGATDNSGPLPSTTYSFSQPSYLLNGGAAVGNSGLEGVAFDPVTGGYFGIKQETPQRVYFAQVSFGAATTGTTSQAFDPAGLGLATLSDVAVLAQNPNFAGTDHFQNLLLLSAGSNRLVEVSRTGQLLSSFDLSGLNIGAIEGVTLDRSGNIFLVSDAGDDPSTLVKLARVVPAVPEPNTWAMLVAGFGMIGQALRRRRRISARA